MAVMSRATTASRDNIDFPAKLSRDVTQYVSRDLKTNFLKSYLFCKSLKRDDVNGVGVTAFESVLYDIINSFSKSR